MFAACNFDEGDCDVPFTYAGRTAVKACQHSSCPLDNLAFTGLDLSCNLDCLKASCDFAREGCVDYKEQLAQCPYFDAVVYSNYRNSSGLIFPDPSSTKGSVPNPLYATGYRGFGRCNVGLTSGTCIPPPNAGSAQFSVEWSESLTALLLSGGSQHCSAGPGSYICTPAQQWAWSEGGAELHLPLHSLTVEVWLRPAAQPACGEFRCAVSTETFAIGVVCSAVSSGAIVAFMVYGQGPFECPMAMLSTTTWSLIAISLSSQDTRWISASVHFNGSHVDCSQSVVHIKENVTSILFSPAGLWGLAVGRLLPDPAYLTNPETVRDDAATYFQGAVATLRVWNRTKLTSLLELPDLRGCSLQEPKGLLACYDFNATLKDYVGASDLSMRLGDKFLPWCTSVDDGGRFLDLSSGVAVDKGEAWGFCPGKGLQQPLPFGDRDTYDADWMTALALGSDADLLLQYPGCGTNPLRLVNNRAQGHGGGLYQASCSARNSACFFAPMQQPSPSLVLLFENNFAGGAGGAIYVECAGLTTQCQEALGYFLGLPLKPPLFGQYWQPSSAPMAIRKLQFLANMAGAWGNNVATAPAQARVVAGVNKMNETALVPGVDALDLSFILVDGLGQQVYLELYFYLI